MSTADSAFTGVPREAEKLNGEFRPDHPFFNPLRNNPTEKRSTHGSGRSPSSFRAGSPSEVATTSAPAATDGTRSHSGDKSASRRRKRPGDIGLQYDTNNHFDVLTRRFGSIWPRVLPWCVANLLLTLLLMWLGRRGYDLTISDAGHKFMSVLVSFLVVTRVNIAYTRFMESASLMSGLFRQAREIVMNTVTFTRQFRDERASNWRLEICRRVIVLLRVTVSVLEYNNKRESTWTLPILKKHEQQALLSSFGQARERYPIILSVFLRTALSSHQEFGINLEVNILLMLLRNNVDFLNDYHGLMKLLSNPFPFPLVQMSRTFLFLWVFTLPFAMLETMPEDKGWVACAIIFFMTFGFVGLELVAITLDDPFGNDDNDLEAFEISKVVFEDIYIFLYDVDGRETADALRKAIEDPSLEGEVKKNYATHVRRNTAMLQESHHRNYGSAPAEERERRRPVRSGRFRAPVPRTSSDIGNLIREQKVYLQRAAGALAEDSGVGVVQEEETKRSHHKKVSWDGQDPSDPSDPFTPGSLIHHFADRSAVGPSGHFQRKWSISNLAGMEKENAETVTAEAGTRQDMQALLVENGSGNSTGHPVGNQQHFPGSALGETGVRQGREALLGDASWDDRDPRDPFAAANLGNHLVEALQEYTLEAP